MEVEDEEADQDYSLKQRRGEQRPADIQEPLHDQTYYQSEAKAWERGGANDVLRWMPGRRRGGEGGYSGGRVQGLGYGSYYHGKMAQPTLHRASKVKQQHPQSLERSVKRRNLHSQKNVLPNKPKLVPSSHPTKRHPRPRPNPQPPTKRQPRPPPHPHFPTKWQHRPRLNPQPPTKQQSQPHPNRPPATIFRLHHPTHPRPRYRALLPRSTKTGRTTSVRSLLPPLEKADPASSRLTQG